MRLVTLIVASALVAWGCSPDTGSPAAPEITVARGEAQSFPPAPDVPAGPLDAELAATLDHFFSVISSFVDLADLEVIGASADPRVAWLLADTLRFLQQSGFDPPIIAAFEELTGQALTGDFPWKEMSDLLIAWDLPAPPGYARLKGQLYATVEPGWAPFFDDDDADIDWRLVSWGGVGMDLRPPEDRNERCRGCIGALHAPAVTDAAGGDWYPDERIVFGVVVDGDARAYPKHIMEVHELVNDELGGTRIGMPYCTLCGSAQAYRTGDLAPTLDIDADFYDLRTSGLLIRSNKVTFEWYTRSVIDTFTGVALSGPMQDAGVALDPVSVVTSTWGDWKRTHPRTTILAEDAGLGRTYNLDPLGGRDDDGPIFPVGDIDPRLPAQEQVLGVVLDDGTAVAFPVIAARRTLERGEPVAAAGIDLTLEAGLVATGPGGMPIVSHQAFWFAWSQFHPDTVVWLPE